MYEESMMGDKLYVIPQEKVNRQDLLNIDRNTKEVTRLKHRLYINTDWEANTIADVVVETMVKIMYSHIVQSGADILTNMEDTLNFYDLFEVAATNKKNENAEKTGNINVKFYTGEEVEKIISDDTPVQDKTWDYVTPGAECSYINDEDRTEAMKKIDKLARKTLSDVNSIILPNDFMAISITKVFIENLYRELIQKLVLTGKNSVMINFNDVIEFHATKKKDGVEIKLRPGMQAKLIIKSDESQLEDESDDE